MGVDGVDGLGGLDGLDGLDGVDGVGGVVGWTDGRVTGWTGQWIIYPVYLLRSTATSIYFPRGVCMRRHTCISPWSIAEEFRGHNESGVHPSIPEDCPGS